jgi:hypothetical protein
LLGCGVVRAPFLFLWWLGLVLHLFMGRGCADDMTRAPFSEVFSSPFLAFSGLRQWACGRLSGQRHVDIVHMLSTGGSSACIVMPSSWLCLHYFMKFSVSGDMILRPGPSVSLDVPVSGNLSGVSEAVASDPSTATTSRRKRPRGLLSGQEGCAHFPHRGECSAVDRLWLPSSHTSVVGSRARRDRCPYLVRRAAGIFGRGRR